MFSFTISCAVVVFGLSLVMAQEPLRDIPEYAEAFAVLKPRARSAVCSAPSKLECEDCTTRRVCGSTGLVIGYQNCTGTKKYCSEGMCTDTPDKLLCRNDALCPEVNQYFPDPDTCTSFHYCDANKMLVQYQCPEGYVYNHGLTNWCRYENPPQVQCSIISCSGKEDQIVVYPANSSIYGFCYKGKIDLMSCPINEAYDVEDQGCSFRCSSEGQFPYPGKCSAYYGCYYNKNGTLEKFVMECPLGFEFNPESGVCSASYSGCRGKGPTTAQPLQNVTSTTLSTPTSPAIITTSRSTPELTTPEPTNTEPTTPEPTTPEPTTPEPTTTESTTTEPVTPS